MKTNLEVVSAFIKHESAQNRSMSTDGVTLFSYATVIGEWFYENGQYTLAVNFNRYSQTTSVRHQAPLRMFMNTLRRDVTISIIVLDSCHKYPVTEGVTVVPVYVPRDTQSLYPYFDSWRAQTHDEYIYNLKGGV